jgi:hypothetical protein
MARNEDGDLRSGTATGDVIQVRIQDALLACLLRLIAGSPVHRLLCLPETRRAFHQQVTSGGLPLVTGTPEEEPLDDLAQLSLGFLSR